MTKNLLIFSTICLTLLGSMNMMVVRKCSPVINSIGNASNFIAANWTNLFDQCNISSRLPGPEVPVIPNITQDYNSTDNNMGECGMNNNELNQVPNVPDAPVDNNQTDNFGNLNWQECGNNNRNTGPNINAGGEANQTDTTGQADQTAGQAVNTGTNAQECPPVNNENNSTNNTDNTNVAATGNNQTTAVDTLEGSATTATGTGDNAGQTSQECPPLGNANNNGTSTGSTGQQGQQGNQFTKNYKETVNANYNYSKVINDNIVAKNSRNINKNRSHNNKPSNSFGSFGGRFSCNC